VERRTLAAAATPLKDGGAVLDEDAFAPLVDFLQDGGLDGILAMGTTGEGILLSVEERKRVAELFVAGPLDVIVHAGAQTTAATVALAEYAASLDAAGVAVIAPPYFRLDEKALLAHFAAAARACAPVPFYVYEFEAVSGYAFPPELLPRLAELAPNLVGMKVSDTPYESFARYLGAGLDVFVGPEAFIARGLEEGAVGSVSALATAFPQLVAAVDPRLAEIRAALEVFPRHAALKRILGRRGVPIREDVRAPLRPLTDDERRELDAWLDELS
jgi:dihydrodipicolinate synthase/N-acetylneuraminate lyase